MKKKQRLALITSLSVLGLAAIAIPPIVVATEQSSVGKINLILSTNTKKAEVGQNVLVTAHLNNLSTNQLKNITITNNNKIVQNITDVTQLANFKQLSNSQFTFTLTSSIAGTAAITFDYGKNQSTSLSIVFEQLTVTLPSTVSIGNDNIVQLQATVTDNLSQNLTYTWKLNMNGTISTIGSNSSTLTYTLPSNINLQEPNSISVTVNEVWDNSNYSTTSTSKIVPATLQTWAFSDNGSNLTLNQTTKTATISANALTTQNLQLHFTASLKADLTSNEAIGLNVTENNKTMIVPVSFNNGLYSVSYKDLFGNQALTTQVNLQVKPVVYNLTTMMAFVNSLTTWTIVSPSLEQIIPAPNIMINWPTTIYVGNPLTFNLPTLTNWTVTKVAYNGQSLQNKEKTYTISQVINNINNVQITLQNKLYSNIVYTVTSNNFQIQATPTIVNNISVVNENKQSIDFSLANNQYTTQNIVWAGEQLTFTNNDSNEQITSYTLNGKTTNVTTANSFTITNIGTTNTLTITVRSIADPHATNVYTYTWTTSAVTIAAPTVTAIVNKNKSHVITFNAQNKTYTTTSAIFEGETLVFDVKTGENSTLNSGFDNVYTVGNSTNQVTLTFTVTSTINTSLSATYTITFTPQPAPTINANITCVENYNDGAKITTINFSNKTLNSDGSITYSTNYVMDQVYGIFNVQNIIVVGSTLTFTNNNPNNKIIWTANVPQFAITTIGKTTTITIGRIHTDGTPIVTATITDLNDPLVTQVIHYKIYLANDLYTYLWTSCNFNNGVFSQIRGTSVSSSDTSFIDYSSDIFPSSYVNNNTNIPVTEINGLFNGISQTINNAFDAKLIIPDSVTKIVNSFANTTFYNGISLPSTLVTLQNSFQNAVINGTNNFVVNFALHNPIAYTLNAQKVPNYLSKPCFSNTTFNVPVVIADNGVVAYDEFDACTFNQGVQFEGAIKTIAEGAFNGSTFNSSTPLLITQDLMHYLWSLGLTGVMTPGTNYILAPFVNVTLNQPVQFANNVTILSAWFFTQMKAINVPITVPNTVTQTGTDVITADTFASIGTINKPLTLPSSLTALGTTMFSGTTFAVPLTVPSSVVQSNHQAFINANFEKGLTITNPKFNVFGHIQVFAGATITQSTPFTIQTGWGTQESISNDIKYQTFMATTFNCPVVIGFGNQNFSASGTDQQQLFKDAKFNGTVTFTNSYTGYEQAVAVWNAAHPNDLIQISNNPYTNSAINNNFYGATFTSAPVWSPDLNALGNQITVTNTTRKQPITFNEQGNDYTNKNSCMIYANNVLTFQNNLPGVQTTWTVNGKSVAGSSFTYTAALGLNTITVTETSGNQSITYTYRIVAMTPPALVWNPSAITESNGQSTWNVTKVFHTPNQEQSSTYVNQLNTIANNYGLIFNWPTISNATVNVTYLSGTQTITPRSATEQYELNQIPDNAFTLRFIIESTTDPSDQLIVNYQITPNSEIDCYLNQFQFKNGQFVTPALNQAPAWEFVGNTTTTYPTSWDGVLLNTVPQNLFYGATFNDPVILGSNIKYLSLSSFSFDTFNNGITMPQDIYYAPSVSKPSNNDPSYNNAAFNYDTFNDPAMNFDYAYLKNSNDLNLFSETTFNCNVEVWLPLLDPESLVSCAYNENVTFNMSAGSTIVSNAFGGSVFQKQLVIPAAITALGDNEIYQWYLNNGIVFESNAITFLTGSFTLNTVYAQLSQTPFIISPQDKFENPENFANGESYFSSTTFNCPVILDNTSKLLYLPGGASFNQTNFNNGLTFEADYAGYEQAIVVWNATHPKEAVDIQNNPYQNNSSNNFYQATFSSVPLWKPSN